MAKATDTRGQGIASNIVNAAEDKKTPHQDTPSSGEQTKNTAGNHSTEALQKGAALTSTKKQAIQTIAATAYEEGRMMAAVSTQHLQLGIVDGMTEATKAIVAGMAGMNEFNENLINSTAAEQYTQITSGDDRVASIEAGKPLAFLTGQP